MRSFSFIDLPDVLTLKRKDTHHGDKNVRVHEGTASSPGRDRSEGETEAVARAEAAVPIQITRERKIGICESNINCAERRSAKAEG